MINQWDAKSSICCANLRRRSAPSLAAAATSPRPKTLCRNYDRRIQALAAGRRPRQPSRLTDSGGVPPHDGPCASRNRPRRKMKGNGHGRGSLSPTLEIEADMDPEDTLGNCAQPSGLKCGVRLPRRCHTEGRVRSVIAFHEEAISSQSLNRLFSLRTPVQNSAKTQEIFH